MSECNFDDILNEDEELDIEIVRIYKIVYDGSQETYPSCNFFFQNHQSLFMYYV